MSLLDYTTQYKRHPVLAWYCHIMDLLGNGIEGQRDLEALIRFYENIPNAPFSIALSAILALGEE